MPGCAFATACPNAPDRLAVRRALIALLFLTPATVVSLALYRLNGASLADCLPLNFDEINYWNEIATVRSVGLAGGYSVADERVAPAGWSHFGPHGPGYSVLYSLPALVFGFERTSVPYFHLLAVGIGCAAWVGMAKPDWRQLLVAVALLGTLWPLPLFLPSALQEPLNLAVALVLAGLIRRDATRGDGAATVVAFVLAAALVRLTWVLVLVPWLAMRWPGMSGRRRAVLAGVTLLAVPLAYLVWSSICSPYTNLLGGTLAVARADPARAYTMLVERLKVARGALLFSSDAPPLALLQRREIVAVLFLALFGRVLHQPRALGFAGLNLVVVFLPVALLYDPTGNGQGFRVLAPHLLLSLLVLLAADWRLVVPFVAANALWVGAFLQAFDDYHRPRVTADPAAVAAFHAKVAPLLRYDPASGPWGNTVLVETALEAPSLTALPRGLGVSVLVDPAALRGPVRSRYVLLKELPAENYGRLELIADDVPTLEYRNDNTLQRVTCRLYRNPDCPDGPGD